MIVGPRKTVSPSTASLHGHVPGDLLHPSLIRVNRDPGDVYSAALKVNEKQHVVGHQPTQRQHLRGEEISPRQQRQMHPNEGCPACRVLALRGGRQSVALQDIADGLIADLVSQIGQRPRNSVITPVTVLLGHAHDQLLNRSLDPRPAGAAAGLWGGGFWGDPRAGTGPRGGWAW